MEQKKRKILAFIIAFSLVLSATPFLLKTHAAEPNSDVYGSISNQSAITIPGTAVINKQVSYGSKPGEFYIELEVTGADSPVVEPTDVVIVYDNSNSMKTNNRVGIARTNTTSFVNDLLSNNGAFQVALVTYGSSVFDGRSRTWGSYQGSTKNWSHKTLTQNASSITSQIPSTTPDNRGSNNWDGGNENISIWHGGTFTQQALREAGTILDVSSAVNKVVILISDGVPTYSYSGSSVNGNGSEYTANHGTRTKNESKALKDKGYKVFTVGIEIGAETGITKAQAIQLMKDISSGEGYFYDTSTVTNLATDLNSIAHKLNNTIVDGIIVDPMGPNFNYTAGQTPIINGYKNGALDNNVANGVTVTKTTDGIRVNGLNLGSNEKVTIKYKIQIKTEASGFLINNLYPTNGTTTLAPNGAQPNTKYNFPEPKASANGIIINGTKTWVDYGLTENRPDDITVKLKRGNQVVNTKTIGVDDDGNWLYTFDEVIWFDNNGSFISYEVEEVLVPGYNPTYSGNNVINTLIPDPAISLVKSADPQTFTKAGDEIAYTFLVKNEGNVTLTNVVLADPLPGLSLSGENIGTLEPGETATVTGTYTITQTDMDAGEVKNTATVTGKDPDGEDVTATDNATVTGERQPAISLVKSADPQTFTKAGDEIAYTFLVKNEGNVTLTNVVLADPLPGLSLSGENIGTLEPGETATVTGTYTITQTDMDAGEVKNTATVTGKDPDGEDVTATDNATVTG
ncbi:MAG: Cna B-type domain-containing protein, partial [Gudongella sp.]|nr:Cna B-type domain-containing protein [Gudongella sp.]